MKKYLFVIILIVCLNNNPNLYGQCLRDSIFTTNSMGTRTENIPFFLTFKFNTDTVHIFNTKNPNAEFLSFAIAQKQDCKWNNDFTEGYTNLLLKSIDSLGGISNPQLKIIYEKQVRRIELLYPNREERVFNIIK